MSAITTADQPLRPAVRNSVAALVPTWEQRVLAACIESVDAGKWGVGKYVDPYGRRCALGLVHQHTSSLLRAQERMGPVIELLYRAIPAETRGRIERDRDTNLEMTVAQFNDGLNQEGARAWFTRALELTL